MELMFNNDYLSIFVNTRQNLMVNVWKKESVDCSWKEFEEMMFGMHEIFLQQGLKYVISDMTNLQMAISPEMQLWLAHNIYVPAVKRGLLKNAILKPDAYIVALSVEQLIDEYNIVSQQEGISDGFDTFKEVQQWLGIQNISLGWAV